MNPRVGLCPMGCTHSHSIKKGQARDPSYLLYKMSDVVQGDLFGQFSALCALLIKDWGEYFKNIYKYCKTA